VRGDPSRCERELAERPDLVDRILATLPPVPDEPERVIRCSREHAEQAVCRGLALATVRREVWRIEIVEAR